MIRISSLEHDALCAGIRAADAALTRFFRENASLELFVSHSKAPRTTPKLEALRAYAELRRALSVQSIAIPATSLSIAGFTPTQIAQFDAVIGTAFA
jgi:O-acetyl-ADP-ribose deacetylase (regulator of RNase III)